jgi:hypothetical protein
MSEGVKAYIIGFLFLCILQMDKIGSIPLF